MTDQLNETVGSKLLSEIERVAAKRERWKGYADDASSRSAFAPAIYLMTVAIDAAKTALQSDDPAACILALKDLQEYDDND